MLESLFFTVLKISMEGGIIGLLILLIRAVVRHKLPKAFLMCLWAVMFFRLMLPFEVSSPTSIYNLFQGEIAIQTPSVNTSHLQTISQNTGTNSTESSASASNPSNTQVQNSNGSHPIADRILNAVGSSLFKNALAIVWLSVATLLFLILSILYFITRLSLHGAKLLKCPDETEWIRRQGLSKRVSIYTSEYMRSPAVFGLYHAKIAFPISFDFSDAKVFRYVLAHELQHVKGYDNLKNQLILLLLCVHWFNPIVWIAKILLTRDMEEACDQRVLKNLGYHNRKQYAMTLITMARYERNLLAFISGFGESAVKARVKSIMAFKKSTIVGTVVAIVIIASIITVFATGKLPGMQTPQNSTFSNSSSLLPGLTNSTSDVPSKQSSSNNAIVSSNSQKDSNTVAGSGTSSNASSVVYTNTQYGFTFNLPASWKGYTIAYSTWQGRALTLNSSADNIKLTGPFIYIRNPKWTATNQYTLQIMVFTLDQWNSLKNEGFTIEREGLSTGNEPEAPSEYGRNSNYVFALPARWHFTMDSVQIFQDIDGILGTKPLHPIGQIPTPTSHY